MRTCTLTKVSRADAEHGDDGQTYLALGESMAMRMWDAVPANDGCESPARDYETVGYVIDGQAELTIDGQAVMLLPGDSWVVPKGKPHSYKIVTAFTAVESTCPAARLVRDDES